MVAAASVAKRRVLLVSALIGLGLVCLASTPQAWEQFRENVRTASLEAAKGVIADPEIAVDDYGTASYGIAVVHGFDRTTREEGLCVVVYDKRTKRAEISGRFAPPSVEWWRGLVDENRHLREQLAALKAATRNQTGGATGP